MTEPGLLLLSLAAGAATTVLGSVVHHVLTVRRAAAEYDRAAPERKRQAELDAAKDMREAVQVYLSLTEISPTAASRLEAVLSEPGPEGLESARAILNALAAGEAENQGGSAP